MRQAISTVSSNIDLDKSEIFEKWDNLEELEYCSCSSQSFIWVNLKKFKLEIFS